MDSSLLINWRKSNITWLVHDYTKIVIKSEPNNKSRKFVCTQSGIIIDKDKLYAEFKDGWYWEIPKYSTLQDTEWERIGNIAICEWGEDHSPYLMKYVRIMQIELAKIAYQL